MSPWPLDDFAALESLSALDGWLTLAPPAAGQGRKASSLQANTSADDTTAEENSEAPLAAHDDCLTVSRDGSVIIDFAPLIRNPEGRALKLSLGRPGHGTLTRNPDGSYTYRPEAGYVGTDRFTYTVSNGQEPASAAINLRITEEENARPGSSATICIQSELAYRTPQAPERLLILRGKPTSETPKIDWEGKSPLGALEVAALWTVPLILGQKKDEEDGKGKRSLAEITGLRFPMNQESGDERK